MKIKLLLLLVCLALFACGEIGLAKPDPEIVRQDSSSGQVNFDYAIWVDCTVQNHGASGNVELTATLNAGGSWMKRATVYVGKSDTRSHRFEFREPGIFDGLEWRYSCEARAQ